jgi:hypothetical protein
MHDLYGIELYRRSQMEERLKQAEQYRLLAAIRREGPGKPPFSLAELKRPVTMMSAEERVFNLGVARIRVMRD